MIELDHEWRLPPAQLVLPGGELHIWRMALEQSPDRIDALARLLSPDEQARSDRFHFERDRRRFIVSHSGLRQILGRYLNLAPHDIRFKPGPYGKPCLAEEFSDSDRFSCPIPPKENRLKVRIEAGEKNFKVNND